MPQKKPRGTVDGGTAVQPDRSERSAGEALHGSWLRGRYDRVLDAAGGLGTEAAKFTIVGGLNFVLTFILFFALVKVLGINHLVGLVAASSVGLLFTYVLNYTWVFKPETRLRFRARLAKYSLANLTSLGLNLLALDFIVRAYGFDPFYVQCALVPLIVAFNFSTAKFWSLRAAE